MENVFHDILERKNDFLDYRNKKFNLPKNRAFFPKDLVHGVGQKLEILQPFPGLI